jgi:hypothetical protein
MAPSTPGNPLGRDPRDLGEELARLHERELPDVEAAEYWERRDRLEDLTPAREYRDRDIARIVADTDLNALGPGSCVPADEGPHPDEQAGTGEQTQPDHTVPGKDAPEAARAARRPREA